SAIRARAQFVLLSEVGEEGPGKVIGELTRQLDEAQSAYAEVWREILNASPMYRRLAATSPEQVLASVREKGLGPDGRLIWYWVGRQRSYVFLVGPRKGMVEAFPLAMPTADASDLMKLARSPGAYRTPTGRDLVLTRKKPAGATSPAPALHGLPLESLVLEGGERPRYALEELPPLLYAPSAAALAFLLERPAPAADRPRSLLTVGDVAYPQPDGKAPPSGQRDAQAGALGL